MISHCESITHNWMPCATVDMLVKVASSFYAMDDTCRLPNEIFSGNVVMSIQLQ